MDAHYTVLARRYRPQTFDEVVGQERIAQALRNAIQAGRVAHAYLFTGARGVGKTSMARILAKALNCPNAVDAVPCNECDVCRSISAGNDVDVSEIDGASNRGIDDIRSLRANVNVRSMRSRYKVYIIDEVHMLTKEAFNALLKTLEEPPPNVKFVFCTTEPNKVPDTILSRCQRFDFGTVETASISGRLRQIALAEGVAVEPAAVELVARRAAGSMRDSQSLFDQLLAFGGDTVSVDDVHRLLGTATDDRLIALVNALLERRRDAALSLFSQALTDGVQLEALTDQLLGYFRDLMVLACGANDVTLMSVGDESRPELERQAKAWGLQTVAAALQILAEAKARMQRLNYGRALAELALIRISLLEDLDRLDELIAELKSGGPIGSSERGPRSAERGTAGEGARPGGRAPLATPAVEKKNDGPVAAELVRPTLPAPPSPPTLAIEPAAAEPTIPAAKFQAGSEQALWAQMLEQFNDMLRNHAQAVSGIAISGPNHLELTFPSSYHFSKQYCERPEILRRLESVAERLAGRAIQIRLRLAEAGTEGEKPAMAPTVQSRPPAARRRIEPQDDPFVQEAVEIFNASIAKVEELTVAPAGIDED